MVDRPLHTSIGVVTHVINLEVEPWTWVLVAKGPSQLSYSGYPIYVFCINIYKKKPYNKIYNEVI